MKVLVVDDDIDIRFILSANLRRWGHDVLEAGSASEAFQACAERAPAIMLLDMSMPGESGLDLLERLDAAGLTPRAVAVVSAAILPGRGGQLEGRRVRHLPKPFGLVELEELMAELVADADAPV